MARKIRFPLKMKNGAEVRTLDELKENFDLESVLGYFTDGKLATWLEDRYYDEKAEAVAALSKDMPDLNAKLCDILEVEYQEEDDDTDLEYIQRRNEKLRILSAFTDDKEILDNIDIVALNQVDLYDVLDRCNEKVYLYGNKFEIPFVRNNICYIGLSPDRVVISIEKGKYLFEYIDTGITFHNIEFDSSINQYVTKGEILLKNNKYEEAIPLIKKAMEEGNIRAYFLSYILDGLDIANIKIKDEEVINIIGDNSFASDTIETILLSIIRDNEDTFYAKLEIIKTYAYSGDFIAMIFLFFSNSDDLIDSEIISMIELCDNAILYYWLGNFFHEKNDNINAIKYYKKSYKLGIYSAVRCLLDLNGINEEEIINPNILYHLGKSYYNEIEYDLAVKWFIKAVEQGNDDALKMLTHMLHNNIIIDDDTLVVKWNRIIAENGDTCAQYKLGNCYYYGKGVGEDYVQAVEWYRKAAEQGNADAQKQLVYMYENGYGVSPDKITAEDWYCKARENYKPSFSFDMADLLKEAEEEVKKGL